MTKCVVSSKKIFGFVLNIDEISRKKHCSVDECNIIVQMKNDGFSYREIANTIQCSLEMVKNAIKYQDKEEKRGRPSKTSEQMDRQILCQTKINPFMLTSQVLVETGAMDNTNTISGARFKKLFTLQNIIIKEKKESKFMLFGNNEKRYVRRSKNQTFNLLYTAHYTLKRP